MTLKRPLASFFAFACGISWLLFHATVDVAFTSGISSPWVVNAAGALITAWGIAVLAAAGPGQLARRGKMVWRNGAQRQTTALAAGDGLR